MHEAGPLGGETPEPGYEVGAIICGKMVGGAMVVEDTCN